MQRQIKVQPLAEFGTLLKKWIKQPETRPADLEAFRAQCEAAGVSVDIADYVTRLEFIDRDHTVLALRLPPKTLVEAGESALQENYKLDRAYEDFFRNPPRTPEQKLHFHNCRIGEYVINNCG